MTGTRKDLVWIKRIAFVIALGLLAYFITMTIVIPVYRFKIEAKVTSTNDKNIFRPDLTWQITVSDSIKQRAIDLVFSESFLLSQIEMTKGDSISLTVNLQDSIIALVVQGLTIYSAKVEDFTISHAFAKTDPFVLAQWLATPFVVDTHFASIPKAPVLYKKAPKDTSEALSQVEMDPLNDEIDPVYFRLELDRKLILNFNQNETPEKESMRQVKIYQRRMRKIERNEILGHLSRFSPIEFVPEIHISLDKKAARVIYRAIPEKAFVAVQLPTE